MIRLCCFLWVFFLDCMLPFCQINLVFFFLFHFIRVNKEKDNNIKRYQQILLIKYFWIMLRTWNYSLRHQNSYKAKFLVIFSTQKLNPWILKVFESCLGEFLSQNFNTCFNSIWPSFFDKSYSEGWGRGGGGVVGRVNLLPKAFSAWAKIRKRGMHIA